MNVITTTAKSWRMYFIGYFSIFLYNIKISKNTILSFGIQPEGVLL